jgi:hypothetical protein
MTSDQRHTLNDDQQLLVVFSLRRELLFVLGLVI